MSEVLLVNPRRRRKHKARRRKHNPRRRKHTAHRRKNPMFRVHRRKHRTHRRRRNPIAGLGGSFTSNLTAQVKSGLVGALGALGLDLAWGYGSKYLPASVSAPATPGNPNYFGLLAKAVGAVAIGMLGGKVLKGKGAALATGAMTVVLHDTLKGTLQAAMPSLPLGAYVGTSPIVAYGAPAVGAGGQMGAQNLGAYPQNYRLMQTSSGIPNANAMGAYVSGYVDGTDGTEW